MSEGFFPFKGHRKPLSPTPNSFKTLGQVFPPPPRSLASAMSIPSWQQPEIPSGQIPPPACPWLSRTGGFQVQLLDSSLRIYGQSWGNWGKSAATSHRKPFSPQRCTICIARKHSGSSHFWEKAQWRTVKPQTERLDKANSSSGAAVLTQQYSPNHHPRSDSAVGCCCLMCTSNSDNATIKPSCWDQAQVLAKTTSPSG